MTDNRYAAVVSFDRDHVYWKNTLCELLVGSFLCESCFGIYDASLCVYKSKNIQIDSTERGVGVRMGTHMFKWEKFVYLKETDMCVLDGWKRCI